MCLILHGDFDAIVDYLKAHDVQITLGPVELYGATGFGTSVYILDPSPQPSVQNKRQWAGQQPIPTATIPKNFWAGTYDQYDQEGET